MTCWGCPRTALGGGSLTVSASILCRRNRRSRSRARTSGVPRGWLRADSAPQIYGSRVSFPSALFMILLPGRKTHSKAFSPVRGRGMGKATPGGKDRRAGRGHRGPPTARLREAPDSPQAWSWGVLTAPGGHTGAGGMRAGSGWPSGPGGRRPHSWWWCPVCEVVGRDGSARGSAYVCSGH